MSNQLLKVDGPVKKKPQVASKATIDLEDDVSIVEVTLPACIVTVPRLVAVPMEPRADQADQVLTTSGVERALWAVAMGVGGLAEEEGDMRWALMKELQGIREVVKFQRDATLDLHDEIAKCVWVLVSLARKESGAEEVEAKDKGKGKEVVRDDETLS